MEKKTIPQIFQNKILVDCDPESSLPKYWPEWFYNLKFLVILKSKYLAPYDFLIWKLNSHVSSD